MVSIVFDLDGTLVDSAADIHAAVNLMLAAEGAGPISLAQVRSFIGNGVSDLVEKVMLALQWEVEAEHHAILLDDFMAHYDAAPTALSELYPGVAGALEKLASAGHRFALCTNKPAATSRAILEHLNISAFFPVVIGGDSLPVRKPHPGPLKAAFAALGEPQGWYVGDSEVDAATATAAGVPLLLFTEGYRKTPILELAHAANFNNFDQLPHIIEQLDANSSAGAFIHPA